MQRIVDARRSTPLASHDLQFWLAELGRRLTTSLFGATIDRFAEFLQKLYYICHFHNYSQLVHRYIYATEPALRASDHNNDRGFRTLGGTWRPRVPRPKTSRRRVPGNHHAAVTVSAKQPLSSLKHGFPCINGYPYHTSTNILDRCRESRKQDRRKNRPNANKNTGFPSLSMPNAHSPNGASPSA
jgi:hypothetical protein